MKSFFCTLFLFTLPLILLLSFYVISDPFKVIWHYNSYFESNKPEYVTLDKDYVSTSTFCNYYQKEQFNSFIFGNSRSIFYEIKNWKKHINPDSKCFHFDASSESLYALDKKLIFIDGKVPLKNALIILDGEMLKRIVPRELPWASISPQLENYSNFVAFHITFLKAFFNVRFMTAYIDLKISGKVKNYMKDGSLLSDTPVYYDLKTNEERLSNFEKEIAAGKYYTSERRAVFYNRNYNDSVASPIISYRQKVLLNNMRAVLKKNRTNFRIVINPLYDQIRLNPNDVDYLKHLFGKNNVFDFSGKNRITDDYHNYYENSHYRPNIAAMIMNLIYMRDIGKRTEMMDSLKITRNNIY